MKNGVNGKMIVARAFAPPGRVGAPTRPSIPTVPSMAPTSPASRRVSRGSRAIVDGVAITDLSGVAPDAYLGSYRVLTTPTPTFGLDGNGPEIARAIDRAVADGMDVLNLSLGEPEVGSGNDSSRGPSTEPRAPAS